jgi:anti-anti-sigma factor
MQLKREEIQPGIVSILLTGRLDILGVQAIELKFTAMTSAERKYVIVDLSSVELMASMGLGMLIENAKTLKHHGKIMILLKPVPNVERVIRMAGLDEILPIEFELAEAINRIQAHCNKE